MKLIRIAFAAITLAIAALATVQSTQVNDKNMMFRDGDPFPPTCPVKNC